MSHTTTAAMSLNTAAALFAGPGRASNSTSAVNDSAAFRFVVDGTIQTLSTQNAPREGPIRGLLFVPSLESEDTCNNTTAPYIPANVTRLDDVTGFGYQTIGLAPWVTPNCTRSFLDASQRAGTKALVFFLPSSGDTKPPPPGDPAWLLGDGDAWKRVNQFPVYAIPGSAGATLMEQLSWYSGNETYSQDQLNVSTAPTQSERWDVRLFTLIDLEKHSKKSPSLWGLLLAILGTILVLCIILLLFYQFIQRRRRESLRRRAEEMEPDLEQYALQQIKVPREFLATLPVYTFPDLSDVSQDGSPQKSDGGRLCRSADAVVVKAEPVDSTRHSSLVEKETGEPGRDTEKAEEERVNNLPSPPSLSKSALSETTVESDLSFPKHQNRLSHSQTTCAICLDDFVPASSIVRELPCGHIYHPECIDRSLTRNSCLCPLCKKCVMPPEFYMSLPDPLNPDMRESS